MASSHLSHLLSKYFYMHFHVIYFYNNTNWAQEIDNIDFITIITIKFLYLINEVKPRIMIIIKGWSDDV